MLYVCIGVVARYGTRQRQTAQAQHVRASGSTSSPSVPTTSTSSCLCRQLETRCVPDAVTSQVPAVSAVLYCRLPYIIMRTPLAGHNTNCTPSVCLSVCIVHACNWKTMKFKKPKIDRSVLGYKRRKLIRRKQSRSDDESGDSG